MKNLLQIALFSYSVALAGASEPGFVRTYQPLGGMANGTIHIESVICVSKYAFNDDDKSLPMRFISEPYLPPSDTGQGNANQAKEAGISFAINLKNPEAPHIILSVDNLPGDNDSAAHKFNNSREAVFTASLECLRLCTPAKLKDATVVLSTQSTDKAWLEEIIRKYNEHKKDMPFYEIPKSQQVGGGSGK